MKLFPQLRALSRIAAALEDIARALNYFALADAQQHNRIYFPGPRKYHFVNDESELLLTDPATVDRLKAEEQDIISSRGFAYLDEIESKDE